MTDGGQSRSIPAAGQGDHWPTAVASLIVGLAFFSLWFWLLPQWLGFRVEIAGCQGRSKSKPLRRSKTRPTRLTRRRGLAGDGV